jgi:hypothetical protein
VLLIVVVLKRVVAEVVNELKLEPEEVDKGTELLLPVIIEVVVPVLETILLELIIVVDEFINEL